MRHRPPCMANTANMMTAARRKRAASRRSGGLYGRGNLGAPTAETQTLRIFSTHVVREVGGCPAMNTHAPLNVTPSRLIAHTPRFFRNTVAAKADSLVFSNATESCRGVQPQNESHLPECGRAPPKS